MRPTMRDIVLLPHVAWLEQSPTAEQDVAASARNGMRRRITSAFPPFGRRSDSRWRWCAAFIIR